MDIIVHIQQTPNPNALKFIVNRDLVPGEQKITFGSAEECAHVPLAHKTFELEHVTQVYFFENVMTVTQDGQGDWAELSHHIETIVKENAMTHDVHFAKEQHQEAEAIKASRTDLTPELVKIEEILDRTIRPYLQGDGGDLEVLSYEDHMLKVRYQGACGGCPSAAAGTLQAIQGILRDEFDPEVEVLTI